MAPKSKGVTLQHTDFPVYSVQALGDRYFLVAGGGGQARTGVKNLIEIFELKHDHEGNLAAESVCRHETGSAAVMNSALVSEGRNHFLIAGMDDKSVIYSFLMKMVTPKDANTANGSDVQEDSSLRKRKNQFTNSAEHRKLRKMITFSVEEITSVKTDFHNGTDPLQNSVKFHHKSSLMVTGGTDAKIRIWKYPEMKKLRETKAMAHEIDDLDISPKGDKVVSICKAGGTVWQVEDGNKFVDLVWPKQTETKYKIRACRYGLIENNPERFNLYTVHIPVARTTKSKAPSYLTIWSSTDYRVKKMQAADTEAVSCMDVSHDGVYIGLGTLSGGVSVFISFSLQRLYHVKEAHDIFVTGLRFMPNSEAVRCLTGNQEFSLLSISADNQIKMHQVPTRGGYNVIWVLIGFLLMIYIIFYSLAQLGL